MKIPPHTGFTRIPGPLGAWTDLDMGETPFDYEGVPYLVYRTDLEVAVGQTLPGNLWQIEKYGFPCKYLFQVRRGRSGEFYAGPSGWERKVSDDMVETMKIMLAAD